MPGGEIGPVLMVHQYYRSNMPSGENVVVDRELALLAGQGVEVIPLTGHSDDLDGIGRAEQAKMALQLWPSRRRRERLTSELLKLKRDTGASLLHAHNVWPIHTPDILQASQNAGLGTILTIHNYRWVSSGRKFLYTGRPRQAATEEEARDLQLMPQVLDSNVKRALYARAIAAHWRRGTLPRAVDRFICMTRFQADKLSHYGLPSDRIAIKPHFVDPPAAHGQDGGEHALFVGRLTDEKGISWLLDNWPHDRIPLYIVGTGPLAEACQSNPRVTFLGQLDRAEVDQQMARCRFLVSTSNCYETFGLVLVEALAAGKPCLVPQFGSMPEIISDGETGATFEPGDGVSLRRSAERLWRLAPELRDCCTSAYQARYHPEANFRTLCSIYQEVLDAKRNVERSHMK